MNIYPRIEAGTSLILNSFHDSSSASLIKGIQYGHVFLADVEIKNIGIGYNS